MTTQQSVGLSDVSKDLQAQRDYAERMMKAGVDFSLTIGDAFVRGIRDIGYKHTGTALDELIDNAIQAEAENIRVVFGYGGASTAKPDRLAVIDDGHGMDPGMIYLAAHWGGTHRESPNPVNRAGFGRYGYGLPSASVSQGKRFTIYSIPLGGSWNSVTLDLKDISDGKYTDPTTGRIHIPPAAPATLPAWLQEYRTMTYGTIVVLEKLDRLTWVTATALQRQLLQHFGITYRNFLRRVSISVNGKVVEATDPLFTTPGFRFYDLDEDRAISYDPIYVDVKDQESGKPAGTVKVRFSRLPVTFGSRDKRQSARGKNENERFEIMKDHNGIIMLREGRQIDVVSRGRGEDNWLPFFGNNDRYWNVEVDFPASLDEEFAITTSKQQVIPSERIWTILKQAGVERVVDQMQREDSHARRQQQAKPEDPSEKRASEQVMEETEKFKPGLPDVDTVGRQKRGHDRLDQEARRRARETGRSIEEEKRRLEIEARGYDFKVEEESMPGAPFYRIDQVGNQTILFLNTRRRFYMDLYAGPESTARLRAALELLLFVLGECELDAKEDKRNFYETERSVWSILLNTKLDRLDKIRSVEDAMAVSQTADEDALVVFDTTDEDELEEADQVAG